MACDFPLKAWRGADGSPVFNKYHSPTKVPMMLPCGRCAGCRLEHSRQWAMRCMHEAKEHDENCFLTLTYDKAHLPADGSLQRADPQLFLKRLRHFYGKGIKFFGCGEYGTRFERPHYHLIMFGMTFEDRRFWKTSDSGEKIYDTKIGDLIWQKGKVYVGSVTFQSCAYVARYCMKKVNGEKAADHYQGKLPEFSMMSRGGRVKGSGGIGSSYFSKYGAAAYNDDKIIVDGVPCKPPRYYDKLFTVVDEARFQSVKQERKRSALRHKSDSTPERLAVRATVRAARMSNHKRSYEI